METFPFAGIGGLAAVTFLVVTYGIFAGLIRMLGAVASGLRLSVVSGIVDGIRDWTQPDEPEVARTTTSPAGAAQPWEELPPGGGQVGEA